MKKLIAFSLILFSISTYSQETKKITKNNLTIKPFNVNSIGVGIGIHYERYLDNTNNFSFVLPIDYSFEVASNSNNTDNNYGIDLNPGFRFYFVEPRSFNWYLGNSFLVGEENTLQTVSDPVGGKIDIQTSRTSFGTLINVGFKGTIKKSFSYNLETGIGIKFIDKYSSNSVYISKNKSLGSFHAGFGYNF